MLLRSLWSFKFCDCKPHSVPLTRAFHFTTLAVVKIIQCQCQMNEWVWGIGGIILTGKHQNTHRKTWPSATLSTTNPIWTGLQVYKWTQASVVSGLVLTVRAMYLQWGKWPKNAFCCIYQSWCVIEMTARNLHIILMPWIKFLTTETVDPILPALKVYFKHYNLTVLNPVMPMKLS